MILCRCFAYAMPVVVLLLLARGAEAASLKAVAIQGAVSAAPPALYMKFHRRGPAIGANAGERVVFEGLAKSPKVKGLFAHDPDDGGSVIAAKNGTGPDGLVFATFKKQFTNPTIDSTGTIVLAAKVKAGLGEGLFARKAGDTSLSTVERTGSPAGTASGFLQRFSYAEPIGLVATTAVAFIGTISDVPNTGGQEISEAIYSCAGGDLNCHSGSGTLTRFVTRGDAVDDRPGQQICEITHLASSEYGVAFRADISSDCTNAPAVNGVFRKAFGVVAGTVETLALTGEPAAFPSSTYQVFRRAIDINNNGTVAFRGRTTSMPMTGVRTTQFICNPATCPSLPAEAAVSVGDTLPNGNAIKAMENPTVAISDAGDLAFFARSKGTQPGKRGIYIRRANGMIEAVAEKGGTAPMLAPMDPAATFASFRNGVAMSADGRVAFLGKIRRASGPKKLRKGIFVFE